jgi:hypothetical protein
VQGIRSSATLDRNKHAPVASIVQVGAARLIDEHSDVLIGIRIGEQVTEGYPLITSVPATTGDSANEPAEYAMGWERV